MYVCVCSYTVCIQSPLALHAPYCKAISQPREGRLPPFNSAKTIPDRNSAHHTLLRLSRRFQFRFSHYLYSLCSLTFPSSSVHLLISLSLCLFYVLTYLSSLPPSQFSPLSPTFLLSLLPLFPFPFSPSLFLQFPFLPLTSPPSFPSSSLSPSHLRSLPLTSPPFFPYSFSSPISPSYLLPLLPHSLLLPSHPLTSPPFFPLSFPSSLPVSSPLLQCIFHSPFYVHRQTRPSDPKVFPFQKKRGKDLCIYMI